MNFVKTIASPKIGRMVPDIDLIYQGFTMRRMSPPPESADALRQFVDLQKAGMGLKFMLPYLPPGASLVEARRLYKRLGQESRTPCSFLDDQLGVQRD